MPEMTGYEVCGLVRQTLGRTTLPIIMVSAKSDSKSIVTGLEAGCNYYVSPLFATSSQATSSFT